MIGYSPTETGDDEYEDGDIVLPPDEVASAQVQLMMKAAFPTPPWKKGKAAEPRRWTR